MSTQHPIRVADAAASTQLDPVMLEALVKRNVLVLSPTESLGDIVQGTGDIALAVAAGSLGQLFFYDETDTTTPDDGQTCLVDASGHRYHLEDMATIHVSAVISQTNTPAVSPTIGDAYIVGIAPTGVWSAHAKNIALYTRRGWVFATPAVGTTVLNRATDANVQYTDAGLWGAFVNEIDAGSILPVEMAFPMGLPVEDVRNAPPVSPVEGLYYIVGIAPTGAFSGHANAVATYVDGSWTFRTPYEGATVYNRDVDYVLIYNGGWAGISAALFQEFSAAGTTSWTKPARGSVALIQLWGAGASGGRAGNGEGAAGGGGGAYLEFLVPLSQLSATESVTVGAGGASRTSNDQNGVAGGSSSFGSLPPAFGGGGGSGQNAGVNGGGGGAGSAAAGGTAANTGTGAAGGADTAGNTTAGGTGSGAGGNAGTVDQGGAGGGGNGGGNAGAGGGSINGGGGGGGGSDGSSSGGKGGDSFRGGGGGGGSNGDINSPGAGGTSRIGGNGGIGGNSGVNAGAGQQPGGGGGGSVTGNSGKGGDGLVRVTVW